MKLRGWWADRIAKTGISPKTANKTFFKLAEMLDTWAELKAATLENPFRKLAFPEADDKARSHPPFSRDWITSKILAPGAFDRLNPEARDILFVLINTGVRPSEITDAPVEDICLDAEIPHLKIRPAGRELKVAHTRREIPLLGVSLDAARQIVERGGVKKYAHKASGWSALVNKYLSNNGLKETPDHVAYSFRHYVEDAMLMAGVDDRVRADIMGHKYQRPNYGQGGGLQARKVALSLIAL